MATLADIPFELDTTSLMKRSRVAPDSDDAEDFVELVDQVREVARPKALYAECFVEERGKNTVRVDGITFTSKAMRINLEDVERVFPFVSTCGCEVDALPIPSSDFVRHFWLDTIKANLLATASKHLNDHLDRTYLLTKTSKMSPGSSDASVWPIEQQKELFELLGGVTDQIGVELTESFLMVPNKTVSGIRFPTETDFRSCQVCHREECSNRIAPFDQEMWEAIQHD